VSSAVLVFWHEQSDKAQYSFDLTLLVGLLSVVLYLPVAVLLYFWLPVPIAGEARIVLLCLMGLYVLLYNVNTMALSILRAQFLARRYFYSVLGASIVLLALLYLCAAKGWSLNVLLGLFIAALSVQALSFMLGSKTGFAGKLQLKALMALAQKLLRYSLPFMGYTLMTLSVVTLDKTVVAHFFSHRQFEQYVYNFQFAYIVNLISVVVGMYNLPIFCELVAKKDTLRLRHSVYANYLLVILATVCGGIVGFGYAYLTGITLASGFWWLVLAFGFTNVFTVNVGLFEAHKHAKHLMGLTILPLLLFWVGVGVSSWMHCLAAIYGVFVLFYAWLMIHSFAYLKRQAWM
jgi:O-antigen/teichoic acid export membrane protein